MGKVAILMGSDSDWEIMQRTAATLEKFGVEHDVRILSAHRTPAATAEYAAAAKANGFSVIIAAAGFAAALPGVVAAHTTLPVIGVPIPSSDVQGVDALYSIVQMPSGVPVACVAIGASGATNAALLAVQMLALSDARLATALDDHKAELAASVEKRQAALDQRRRD